MEAKATSSICHDQRSSYSWWNTSLVFYLLGSKRLDAGLAVGAWGFVVEGVAAVVVDFIATCDGTLLIDEALAC